MGGMHLLCILLTKRISLFEQLKLRECVIYLVLWNDRTKHSWKPHPNFWLLSSSFLLLTWCYITSENPSNPPPLPYCKLSTGMGVACMITRLGWSVVSREQFHNDICTWSCGSWFGTHVISSSGYNISICRVVKIRDWNCLWLLWCIIFHQGYH